MNQIIKRKRNTIVNLIYILIFFSTLIISISSCKTSDQERQVAKIAKEEKAKKKQATKDYEKAHKRHMKIQDKDTRKRMKGNKSKMMGQTSVNKRSWWQRIFHPKKEKTCNKLVSPGI